MLHAELESRNICCPVLNPQIVGGDLLPGVVTTYFRTFSNFEIKIYKIF